MSHMGVLCGTPENYCNGSVAAMSNSWRGSHKSHTDRVQAFKCYARYLTRVKGYTKVGSREFKPSDGGPILVLTKKIRFGGELMRGKSGGETKSKRKMPKLRTSGTIY